MDTVSHLAEDSDEDFSGMPALEDKEQNQAPKQKEQYFREL